MISNQQKFLFAIISLPFLLLVSVEHLWQGTFFNQKSTATGMSFLADLIFLNIIHVGFSYFLFYKIKEFRQVFDGYKVHYLFGGVALLVVVLMLTDYNEDLLGVLAILHAYLQSMGIFLLAFALPGNRKLIKSVALGFLVVLVLVKKEIWVPQLEVSYILATSIFLVFSALSKSWLGALFAVRFFLWFSPTAMSGTSVAAIHGLEYLVVVTYLLRNQEIKFNLKDIPIAGGIIGVLSYYTVQRYFFISSVPMDFIFFFCVYSHYAFDTYSFRFQFAKQRALILPLFSKSKSSGQ